MSQSWIDTFPALSQIEGLTHGFIRRHPEIDVKTDRATALVRLEPHFDASLSSLGVDRSRLATCEQVHHSQVDICGQKGPEDTQFPDSDGLVTNLPGQFLGILVADCGAVYIVDPVRRVCGMIHSGKKGSELGIVSNAIAMMSERFGCRPEDLHVQLSPCIRPPHYEIDFAEQIRQDCLEAGVPESQYHDCGISTADDLDRYYSYRMEKGETGRLLAVLGFAN